MAKPRLKKIAFQGEPGANSHLAARDAYPRMEALACPTFEDAIAAVKSGKIAPKVFVAVGGEEEKAPAALPPGMTREQVVKSIAEASMIRNAMDLGDRLKALPGAAGYAARAGVFDGETHISVPWATVGPFLNFALAPSQSEP